MSAIDSGHAAWRSRSHPMGSPRLYYWFLAPISLTTVVLLIVPLLYMLRLSVSDFVLGSVGIGGFTFENYTAILSDSYYYYIILRTGLVGLAVCVLCLILGFPVAYYIARVSARHRNFLIFLVIMPIMVGVVVRSYGWIVLFADSGPVNQLLLVLNIIDAPLKIMNTWWAVIIALTEIMLPFMILPLTSSLERVNPLVEEAARTLGANRIRVFFLVTVPLVMPGIASGLILVFSLAVTSYATPALLGGPSATVVSSLVVQQMLTTFNWPLGSALAILLISLTAAMTMGGFAFTPASRGGSAR